MRQPFDLYLLTNGYDASTKSRVEAALNESARAAVANVRIAIQLRARHLSTTNLLSAAAELRRITRTANVPLIINDRIDVALAVDADGAQLTSQSLFAAAVRRFVPRDFLLGVSIHRPSDTNLPVHIGANFFVFAPVFDPLSKPRAQTAQGIAALRETVLSAPIPVFALGGVDAGTAGACLAAGAHIASLGSVLGQAKPEFGLRALVQCLVEHRQASSNR